VQCSVEFYRGFKAANPQAPAFPWTYRPLQVSGHLSYWCLPCGIKNLESWQASEEQSPLTSKPKANSHMWFYTHLIGSTPRAFRLTSRVSLGLAVQFSEEHLLKAPCCAGTTCESSERFPAYQAAATFWRLPLHLTRSRGWWAT